MTEGEHWATVELDVSDREGLEDGDIIERLIESDGRWVDVLEMRWQTKGALSTDANAAEREWPHLFEQPPLETGGGKPTSDVYEDRNLLACAFVRMCDGGYTPDPESPEEWAIVFVHTPYGQVSWHVPLEMAEGLGLIAKSYEWDGHDRERKNDVLATWTKDGLPL